ncbi:hypothetical protein EXU57_00900 [Segetibacter sp. 3557_3]|nr:hypothetical protein EXU57_00900 [Segetibacter sp. 3557_3]
MCRCIFDCHCLQKHGKRSKQLFKRMQRQVSK